MKVVLFCGGMGTRLREYSETIPKPLVTIGNRPIIWHIMKYYASFGHNEFILCLGYKGEKIKEYFLNYNECDSNDFVMSNGGRHIDLLSSDIDDWKITFIDTGAQSNIGERLKAVEAHIDEGETFLANYSDGLSDLPLDQHIATFEEKNVYASFVCVKPVQSFHNVLSDDEGYVSDIRAISQADHWINGGFFILNQAVFDYIGDGEELVEEPFQRLIQKKKLFSYKYQGFWRAMDTLKDKMTFDELHSKNICPWQVWEQR